MIAYFARHPTASNLLMLGILALGVTILPTLQRETFPRFESSKAQINLVYPGARPETVEEAICLRVEDAIDGVDDVREISCEASEGIAVVTVEMMQGANLDRFMAELKTEIEAIDDFPDLVEDPIIKQLGFTDFVASVAITGGFTRPDLKSYAEEIKRRMQAFGGIPKVEVTGFSEREFRIELADSTLRGFGLDIQDIARTVELQNIDLPLGAIQSRDGELLLRFADQRRTVEDLRALVVVTSTEGAQIRLGDIARIEDRFSKDEEKILFDGEPAAFIQVTKSASEDILVVANRVRAFLEEERKRAPPGVQFTIVESTSDIVKDRLSMLIENGIMGLVLVAISMWLFFGARYAFWITAGLPVAFSGGIAAMTFLGLSLNMLTMVGLLMVIGILMDDAIVISESIASKRETSASPLKAAIDGVREVAPGVVSSFLTTLCIFGSLAFLEGDIGQVLRVVPIVMIAVLAFSLVEAFLILPHHLKTALQGEKLRRGKIQATTGRGLAWLCEKVAVPFARHTLRHRYTTLGCAIAALLLAISTIAGGALKFSAFPEIEGDTVQARILLPQGTPLEHTEEVATAVLEAAEAINIMFSGEQLGGQQFIRHRTVTFNKNEDSHETGPHVATVSLDLIDSEARPITNQELFSLWREETGAQADVIALRFSEPTLGPGGLAIEFQLTGENLDELKAASDDLKVWLEGYEGVADVLDDLRYGKPEITIRMNDEGRVLGLNAKDIADQIRAAYYGSTIDKIQLDTQSYEINARLATADRDDLATLDAFVVVTPLGALAPLSSVTTLERERGFSRINRVQKRRTVTVQGDVDTRVANANEVVSDTMRRFIPELMERYPSISISLRGQNSEAAETQRSMITGFTLGLFGVFLVLSLQFRSYIEPVVVMVLIPFAFIGVVIGHLLIGIDFSMASLLGFAALSGVVVNDSILLVNQIKANQRSGSSVIDIVPEAVRSRFRPVLLTSITTIAGLFPLLLETSLQAQVLIPLVTSLAFGLLASTVLVLFVVPAFYSILHDFGATALAREGHALEETGG